jgi:hypothetical protein
VIVLGGQNSEAVGEQRLVRDVRTPIGTYAPGTIVRIISKTRRRARVCLDPAGYHPTNRCHVVRLPRTALDGVDIMNRRWLTR